MNSSFEFNSLLAPVDLSPASEAMFERAMSLATGDDPSLILLHVIDPTMVEFASEHGWGATEEIAAQMRSRAEQALEGFRARGRKGLQIDVIVSEGVPFLEILRKSEDFAVDAIVLGKTGKHAGIEKLLFGSTAEKVLRASLRPVIVLPIDVE